jgi:HSP20 family protein
MQEDPMKHSDELEHLREQLEHLLGLSQAFLSGRHAWRPAADALETGDAFVVRLEVAGVRREDLSLSIEGRLLRVRGVRRDPMGPGQKRFHKLEIHVGPFERQFLIPAECEGSEPSAAYEAGILTVTVQRNPASPTGASEIPIQ